MWLLFEGESEGPLVCNGSLGVRLLFGVSWLLMGEVFFNESENVCFVRFLLVNES